ncbi:MAG: lysylphosphatidylglycerol synthase domain-containing protein [Thermoanaerobaculum sp.]
MKRWVWRGLALALGTGFALALFLVAQPKTVVELVQQVSGLMLLAAFAVHLAIVGTRALRLRVLSGNALESSSALLLFTVSQAASALLPWRLGEVTLPPLAKWTVKSRLSQGAFWWLAGRFLDLWSLALAVTLLSLSGFLPFPLVYPALLLLFSLAFAAWVSVRRAYWHAAVRWLPTRRLLRGALRMRQLFSNLGKRPVLLAQSLALSLAAWGLIVTFTGLLCRGMGVELSLQQLLLSVLGATLGAAVPIAGVGNLGPVEAGFASALSLTGVPATQALSLGFALHFWTLAFQLLLGFPAMAGLVLKARS